ncbi:bolA-like protein 2 isoform X2 [Bombyx mori]|uniref:bolA-like protein 2 isoform X2 n=1 Tax=Bombyx mori TaxID=7091 RepID=UPI002ED3E42F
MKLFFAMKEVTDESDGCGAKFSVLIVSDKFKGKPLLARHRLVNTLLQEELKTIHAFTQKTLTVDQWKTQ